MTFLALDYGAKRLGLAISDDDARLALPLQTVTRRPNDTRGDLAALLGLIRARGADAIVLGIPGGSPQSDEIAAQARRFTHKLLENAREVGLELAFFETDERFSTAQAHQELRSTGISTRKSRQDSGGDAIDARAAAIFLQTFLDSQTNAQNNFNPLMDNYS
ncbi:MAG TPA: Holliday junction resolvase RuvX [Abditibacterium sp.]|jgi:putative Holliday junction resolvase